MTDTWHPMDTAPEDGTTVLGRYDEDEIEVRWATRRTRWSGDHLGPGWVAVVDGLYIDEPQCWRPLADAEASEAVAR